MPQELPRSDAINLTYLKRIVTNIVLTSTKYKI